MLCGWCLLVKCCVTLIVGWPDEGHSLGWFFIAQNLNMTGAIQSNRTATFTEGGEQGYRSGWAEGADHLASYMSHPQGQPCS